MRALASEPRSAEPREKSLQADDAAGAVGYAILAVLSSVAFTAISLLPSGGLPKYRYSFLFLVPIVWAAFAFRRRLALSIAHFAAFAFALVLHDLGAFGWYQQSFFGLQYDWYVHFVFGVVGGLILARFFELRLGVRGPLLALLVVLVTAGIGGIHEIVEAASTMFLGQEYGMLAIGPHDNPYDTHEDLLNNVLGACTALALRRLARGRSAERHTKPSFDI